jgi:hypothetical protein
VTLFVDVKAVGGAGRFSIEEYAERHGRVSRTRSHDEMDVAGVEAERDSAIGSVQHARPPLNRPVAR